MSCVNHAVSQVDFAKNGGKKQDDKLKFGMKRVLACISFCVMREI